MSSHSVSDTRVAAAMWTVLAATYLIPMLLMWPLVVGTLAWATDGRGNPAIREGMLTFAAGIGEYRWWALGVVLVGVAFAAEVLIRAARSDRDRQRELSTSAV